MITDDDIKKLRVIEGAASGGPWLTGGYYLRYKESRPGVGLPWKTGRCYMCKNAAEPCRMTSSRDDGMVLHLAWTTTHEGHPTVTSQATSEVVIDGDCDWGNSRNEDLVFICASREWVHKLLDEVQRLKGELSRSEECDNRHLDALIEISSAVGCHEGATAAEIVLAVKGAILGLSKLRA